MSMAVVFVILVMIGAAMAAGILFLSSPAPVTIDYAVDGDRVRVDYIGIFENGWVFDTSLEAVANDNGTYPKSISFQYRTTGFQPIEFTVGAGQMIQGFDEGVIGMREGDRRTLIVTPDKGYGYADPSLIEVKQLIEDLPLKEFMNASEFSQRFFVEAIEGQVIQDPFWKWDVRVFDVSGENVTILHEPDMDMIIQPYKEWDTQVIAIDSGANEGVGIVRVEHLLQTSDEYTIKTLDSKGEFILTEVNPAEGTFTLDYNREVVGKTLIFHVTMVQITKPE